MSTVLAIFRRDGEAVDPEEMDAMLAGLQHRICDGHDISQLGCTILGHQHLWTTPEEQGERQPLTAVNRCYTISFDGRLDNRQELLERLDLLLFGTEPISDAEIVLHAYAKWQKKCVPRLLGDFAFIIWDSKEQRLFIARDPLGVRQISYYLDARLCIVASTVGPILAHPSVKPEINQGKIAEYIVQYEYNQEESPYRNINFCPPSHYVTISKHGITKERYWLPDPEKSIHYARTENYVDQFQDLFHQSVTARLRFECKPGFMLSSGMDSSSVTAVACKDIAKRNSNLVEELDAYTLTFESVPESDEQTYVRRFAEQIGIKNHFVRADTIRLIDSFPLPFMVPDSLPYIMSDPLMWHLAQRMKYDGVKIALHGAYGDILFTPQNYWASGVVSNRNSSLISDILTPKLYAKAHLWQARQNVARLKQSVSRGLLRQQNGQKSLEQNDQISRSGITRTLAQSTDLVERIQGNSLAKHFTKPDIIECVAAMIWSYYVHSSSRLYQGMLDMGIEGRDPFRDRRLVDYILSVPPFLSGRPGSATNKWLLREAMQGIVPEQTRTRSRHNGPIAWSNIWFGSSEGRKLSSLLRRALVTEYDYYEPGWIEKRLHDQERRPHYDHDLWRCATLEIWLRSFDLSGKDGPA